MITLQSTLKDLYNDTKYKKYTSNLHDGFDTEPLLSTKIGDINPHVWPNQEAINCLNYIVDELDSKGLADHVFLNSNTANMIVLKQPKKAKFAIVCAGGGYSSVGGFAEAIPVCKRLYEHGFTTISLNYYVKKPILMKANDDLAECVRYVLSHLDDLHCLPNDYMIIGFSAGGHLVSQFGTDNHGYSYYNLPKPGLLGLCYPVICLEGEYGHQGSNINLLGDNPSESLLKEYSSNRHVKNYPPTFIWQCDHDNVVPFENSLIMLEALRKENIPVMLKAYDSELHGLGISTNKEADGWVELMLDFYQKCKQE